MALAQAPRARGLKPNNRTINDVLYGLVYLSYLELGVVLINAPRCILPLMLRQATPLATPESQTAVFW